MLHFLRNLRRNNMNSKYLKYAIGEIILVVVGILIALQINGWNEQRKLNKEEKQLLENLKFEFTLRKTELEEFNEFSKIELSVIDRVFELSNNSQIENSPELDSLFSKIGFGYGFNDSFKLLDLLFNTGKIDLIQKQELKDELLLWPWLVAEHMEEIVFKWDEMNDRLAPMMNRYLSMPDIAEYYSYREYNFPIETAPKITSDYHGLLKNQEFINMLFGRRHILNVMYRDRQKLIESADKILTLMEN